MWITPGMGRVGDPPALDRRVVHAGDQQAVRLRAPPEAPAARHLLGRHELGEPVRDALAVRLGQGPVPVPLGAHHAQGALGDVGDVPAVGGGARVDHRPGGGQFARGADLQLGHEEPP